jgi:hypothetical protein
MLSLFLRAKEKELKMLWRVKKDGRTSYLAGTAHFFPYTFKESIGRLLTNVSTVLLEGPLDATDLDKVRSFGVNDPRLPALYDALDAKTVKAINKQLSRDVYTRNRVVSNLDFVSTQCDDWLQVLTQGLKPWMAFFKIWSCFLQLEGWHHSVDLDAFHAAREMGKKIHYLESIEEQLEVLESIPLDRIISFLGHSERWHDDIDKYVSHYLEGDLDGLLSLSQDFPSRCEPVIETRDFILYERLKGFFAEGDVAAFVGAPHTKAIKEMLIADGYLVG